MPHCSSLISQVVGRCTGLMHNIVIFNMTLLLSLTRSSSREILNREYLYIAFFSRPWRAFYYIWFPGSGNNNSQQRNPYQRIEDPSRRGCFYWPERCNHKVKFLLKGKNNIPSYSTPGFTAAVCQYRHIHRGRILLLPSRRRASPWYTRTRGEIEFRTRIKTEPERT